MELNIILTVGSFLFAILLLFLLFIFSVSILSLFIKEKRYDYEPYISVIIPCYNEEKNILSCLKNLFSSDYDLNKIQTIVIDDGSSDNTLDILDHYKDSNNDPLKDIKIIKGKHSGKSDSLNLGVKASDHEIIFSLDADTILKPDTLKKLASPFKNKNIGATNGSCIVKNKNSILGLFQNIEYHYNNLIRKSFSTFFKSGIWFFGAFACYRKSVLKEIGYFKKDTLTEDMDIALEIYKAGYRIKNIHNAIGKVNVPDTISSFISQRKRWWAGNLQALYKNRTLFNLRSNVSILFLFINQFWWSFYAILSTIVIAYSYMFWLPYNISDFYSTFMYTFRWFSLLGSFHVLYMIPEWGISLYSIFGVLAGIITTILILISLYTFNEKLKIKNILGIFFYFPYTIVLNTIIILSLVKITFIKEKYFKY